MVVDGCCIEVNFSWFQTIVSDMVTAQAWKGLSSAWSNFCAMTIGNLTAEILCKIFDSNFLFCFFFNYFLKELSKTHNKKECLITGMQYEVGYDTDELLLCVR